MVAANSLITVDNPSFRDYYVRFTDIRIGDPKVVEDFKQTLTPHECRVRNLTYAAPILVDVEQPSLMRPGEAECERNV